MRVSVVIPVYNPGTIFQECLLESDFALMSYHHSY